MYRLSFKITFILIHKDEYHFLAIHNIFKLKRYFVVNIICQKGQKKPLIIFKILLQINLGRENQNLLHQKSRLFFLDRINIEILRNIIKNHDIKSSEISEKIDIPLSTIQRRRRSRLETSALLKKKF